MEAWFVLRVTPSLYYDASHCFHYYHHYICIFHWLSVLSAHIPIRGWFCVMALRARAWWCQYCPCMAWIQIKVWLLATWAGTPRMFVCLETAGIHITEGLQFHSGSDVGHYVATAMRTQLISIHLKFEAPVCDKWWSCTACVTSLPLIFHC